MERDDCYELVVSINNIIIYFILLKFEFFCYGSSLYLTFATSTEVIIKAYKEAGLVLDKDAQQPPKVSCSV